MRPRILLADDHVLVSQGLQMLLEKTCDVVGSVTDGRALLDAAREIKPDVIVSDIAMPIMNGIEALRQLRREGDHTKVIFVTMHTDAQIAVKAFLSGATGYVIKHAAGDELIAAIRAALQGQIYLTPLIAPDVLQVLLQKVGSDKEEMMKSVGAKTDSELIQLAIQRDLAARFH